MPLYKEDRPAWQVERIRYNLSRGARKLADQLSRTPAFPIAGPAADLWHRSMEIILERGPAEYIRYAASVAFHEIISCLDSGRVPDPGQVERKAMELVRRAHEAPQRDARLAKDALQRLAVRVRRSTL